jgi:signal transduction histidine kinase
MGAFNLITLTRLGPDEVPLRDQLNEALVRELVPASKGGAAALLFASLLLWMLVRRWTSTLGSALFLALVGVTLVRLLGSIWLERGLFRRLGHRRVFVCLWVIYLATGSCLGAVNLAACSELPLVRELMLLVMMIAINATAIVTLAASPLLYVVYLGPAIAAWFIIAFTRPLPGLEPVLQLALPVYSIVAAVTMRSVHRSLRNNVVLRLQLGTSLGELRDTQSRLVEASRQAGRSDVATAVLHNVGNVLNSVNVSAALVHDIVTRLRTAGLSRIAAMIDEHRDDLGAFFRDDQRGQKLPSYFTQLQAVLDGDKAAAVTELQALIRNIDHIKVIVASQQSHVRPGGAVETFELHELLDDALRFSAPSCQPHGIEIVRDFDALPSVTLDRHKALQILMNLLANARDAVLARPGDRRITVHARGTGHELEITVEDNGCGVEPDQLDRIFQLGFTTKPSGHGLGLHYSACAATELHGRLTVHSAGPGHGAAFRLVLPLDARAATAAA